MNLAQSFPAPLQVVSKGYAADLPSTLSLLDGQCLESLGRLASLHLLCAVPLPAATAAAVPCSTQLEAVVEVSET